MEHPIAPPLELVREWWTTFDIADPELDFLHFIATQAARWGADQELEACVQHVRNHQWGFVGRPDGTKVHTAVDLQLARRPKPPSLKEQALERCNDYIDPDGIIRRALEALPDV